MKIPKDMSWAHHVARVALAILKDEPNCTEHGAICRALVAADLILSNEEMAYVHRTVNEGRKGQ